MSISIGLLDIDSALTCKLPILLSLQTPAMQIRVIVAEHDTYLFNIAT